MDDGNATNGTAATGFTDEFVAPRNEVESVVAAILAELLDVERISIDDNFLLLGGESLSATQAASRLHERFGCDVQVRSIFLGTVADIAAEITAHMTATVAASEPA
jgi:acyl carrier protein